MVRYSPAYTRRHKPTMRAHYPIRRRRITAVTAKDIIFLVIAGLILVGTLHSIQGIVGNITEGIAKVHSAVAKEPPQIQIQEKIIEVPSEPPKDERVEKLQSFLESKNSPLAPYAHLIVDNADEFGIGWTEIVSISSIESSYCKNTVSGSHNCWGLGGENKFMHFASYKESIRYMSALIGNDYALNKNMAVQTKYCPTTDCYKNWPQTVTAASKEILTTNK